MIINLLAEFIHPLHEHLLNHPPDQEVHPLHEHLLNMNHPPQKLSQTTMNAVLAIQQVALGCQTPDDKQQNGRSVSAVRIPPTPKWAVERGAAAVPPIPLWARNRETADATRKTADATRKTAEATRKTADASLFRYVRLRTTSFGGGDQHRRQVASGGIACCGRAGGGTLCATRRRLPQRSTPPMPIPHTGPRCQSESHTNKKVRDWNQNFNQKWWSCGLWREGVSSWSWGVGVVLFADRGRDEKTLDCDGLGASRDENRASPSSRQ